MLHPSRSIRLVNSAQRHEIDPRQLGICPPWKAAVARGRRSAEHLAYALQARAPEMPPKSHQQSTIATGSNLRT
jgi:hypothetical protein